MERTLFRHYVVGGVIMDLSKVFDYIPHNLLIAKCAAYRFDKNSLKYLYCYLKNRQQCVKINNACGEFKEIIWGVPQGSIVGPILINAFLNNSVRS